MSQKLAGAFGRDRYVDGMNAILALLLLAVPLPQGEVEVRTGSSPQIARGTDGVVRMVFGHKDTIFAVTSGDNGRTFGPAVLVGVVTGMHLGNTRGPTIASSRRRSVVLAADVKGRLTTFQLDHLTARWERDERALNDVEGSAPEGLATIAADAADKFYAVWLDVRQGRQNNIYFAQLPAGGQKVAPNRALYVSPDGHVCECCRPSIAVSGRNVAIMFRNWLGGARDMYLMRSADGGATFSSATRLGRGTWRLDACPMDGGSLRITARGDIVSVWRRELTVYGATGSGGESPIAEGRSAMMDVRGADQIIVWQDRSVIKLRRPGRDDVVVADGRLPQVAALNDGSVLVAWERGGSVYYRRY